MKKTTYHNKIVDYLYIDDARVMSYLEQFQNSFKPRKKRSWKFSLSLGGPRYETVQETVDDPKVIHEKLENLRVILYGFDDLATRRPRRMPNNTRLTHDKQFVVETMVARKVVFPKTSVADLPGVKGLAVWVSDPDPMDFSDIPWDFAGTFLYLTEFLVDEGPFQTVYSGCSALQAIANSMFNRPFLERDCKEPLGRENLAHPIEKLQRLGGMVGDLREIECLYRIRYMTNEQSYLINGKERRVNDLLAYPIYIATAAQAPDWPDKMKRFR
jgi:hypothetical protein